MYSLLSSFVSLTALTGLAAAGTSCVSCSRDACAAAVVPTPAASLDAMSACADWLSVTTTPTTTTTATVTASVALDSTTTVTTQVPTSVTSTSTQVLVKRQEHAPAAPPGIPIESGIIVPVAVPSRYGKSCSDAGAFFSACLCIGAPRTTITTTGVTITMTITVTELPTSITAASMPTTGTSSIEPAPTSGLLVVRPEGTPVDGWYLFANSSYESPSNEAIALQFVLDRGLATSFSIDGASLALKGYAAQYIGVQAEFGGLPSSGNFYNTYVLAPESFAASMQLPVPQCSNTGPSGSLRCAQTKDGDTRNLLQYCLGDSTWFSDFGYTTLGFLVLDSQVDQNCRAVDLQFETS